MNSEERFVLENYNTTVKSRDYIYWVRLPWKVKNPFLTTHYNLVKGRMNSNLKKLKATGIITQNDEIINYL